jgi:hypothetical protein
MVFEGNGTSVEAHSDAAHSPSRYPVAKPKVRHHKPLEIMLQSPSTGTLERGAMESRYVRSM